jgi:PhnB protein
MTTTNEKSATIVQPYLFLDGKCEEALQFYKEAVGAEIGFMLRFKDSPEPPQGDSGCGGGGNPQPDKILHAEFTIGNSKILASDGECKGAPAFQGFSLSLTVATEAEAERTFAELGKGGQVIMPLGKTFFSPKFGMLADRFGVNWMVYVVPAASES